MLLVFIRWVVLSPLLRVVLAPAKTFLISQHPRATTRSFVTYPLCVLLPNGEPPCYGLGGCDRALVGPFHGNTIAHALRAQRFGSMRRVGGSRTKTGDGWTRRPCEFLARLDPSACGPSYHRRKGSNMGPEDRKASRRCAKGTYKMDHVFVLGTDTHVGQTFCC